MNTTTAKIWTGRERLEIVVKIAQEMLRHPGVQHDNKLIDMAERLLYLASASHEFLEANEKRIVGVEK